MVSTQSRKVSEMMRGFTLIEVLVALAIIAISMVAALNTSGSQASNAAYLREKTIADWVALNEMTRFKLAQSVTETGTTHGDTKMAGITWYWTRKITPLAAVKNVYEIQYKIYRTRNRKNSLITLVSYSGKQQSTSNPTGISSTSSSSYNTGSSNGNSN